MVLLITSIIDLLIGWLPLLSKCSLCESRHFVHVPHSCCSRQGCEEHGQLRPNSKSSCHCVFESKGTQSLEWTALLRGILFIGLCRRGEKCWEGKTSETTIIQDYGSLHRSPEVEETIAVALDWPKYTPLKWVSPQPLGRGAWPSEVWHGVRQFPLAEALPAGSLKLAGSSWGTCPTQGYLQGWVPMPAGN